MIKIFRKIRQKMIKENRVSNYFLYAIGEIVLVVIGIFIALQLNTLKDNRKLNKITENYYNQLLEDIKSDKTYARSTISSLDSTKTKYNNYLDSYKVPGLSINEVIASFDDLEFGSIGIYFKTTTIATLLDTGDIKLMPPLVRNKLSAYKGSLNNVMIASDFNDIGKDNLTVKGSSKGGVS